MNIPITLFNGVMGINNHFETTTELSPFCGPMLMIDFIEIHSFL